MSGWLNCGGLNITWSNNAVTRLLKWIDRRPEAVALVCCLRYGLNESIRVYATLYISCWIGWLTMVALIGCNDLPETSYPLVPTPDGAVVAKTMDAGHNNWRIDNGLFAVRLRPFESNLLLPVDAEHVKGLIARRARIRVCRHFNHLPGLTKRCGSRSMPASSNRDDTQSHYPLDDEQVRAKTDAKDCWR